MLPRGNTFNNIICIFHYVIQYFSSQVHPQKMHSTSFCNAAMCALELLGRIGPLMPPNGKKVSTTSDKAHVNKPVTDASSIAC